MDVLVTTLNVTVTRPDGQPLRGLTAADFEVSENGQRLSITHFAEISAGAKDGGQAADPRPPEPRGRRFLVFVDEYSVHPRARTRVLSELDAAFDRLLQPGDEVLIAAWNNRLFVDRPLTRDRREVKDTLAALMAPGARGGSLHQDREIVFRRIDAERFFQPTADLAYDEALGHARRFAEETRAKLRAMTADLQHLMRAVAGGDARKVLIFVGDHFPAHVGMEAFEYTDRHYERFVRRPRESRLASLQHSEQALVRTVANLANALDIVFYAISPGSMGEAGILDDQWAAINVGYVTTANTVGSLAVLSEATGGASAANEKQFRELLARLETDLSNYYSLGYRPARGENGQRSVRVRVRVPNVIVRVKKNYAIQSAEKRAGDSMISSLFGAKPVTDFAIDARVVARHPVSGKTRLTLEIRVPFAALTLLRDEDGASGAFLFLVAARDGASAYSDVSLRRIPLRVTEEQMRSIDGKMLSVAQDVEVRSDTTTLALGVMDEMTRSLAISELALLPELSPSDAHQP